ncbi:DNRLRE domain-containing protein, partial [uncultured Clostridium sp.]|uniref:DNRLRE domain-containing protein n=1 Tax=uncultured Clostridium sp. TaxID=59620 RepID=UPI003459F13E
MKSAFLYIFLEGAQSNARKVTISIKENKNDFDITSVTWANAPKVNNHHEICFDIYPRDINRYIKIDITPIVNNWTITKENFGLTIFDDSRCNNSLIKFSSLNSKKPPYLSIC